MLRQIVQVKARRDYKVYVYFDDGAIKLFDVDALIKKGGVFSKIADIEKFVATCTVMNNTLAWDINGNFDEYNCIDIDPETIYREGQEVEDPLSSTAAD